MVSLRRPVKLGSSVLFFDSKEPIEDVSPRFAARRCKHRTARTARSIVSGTIVPIVAPITTELLVWDVAAFKSASDDPVAVELVVTVVTVVVIGLGLQELEFVEVDELDEVAAIAVMGVVLLK